MREGFVAATPEHQRNQEPDPRGASLRSLEAPALERSPDGASDAITASRRLEARSRLASDLRAIALDLLGLHEHEEMPAQCATWIQTTIDALVAETCDPTLSGLVGRLSADLRVAPTDVVRQIQRARLRHEVGLA